MKKYITLLLALICSLINFAQLPSWLPTNGLEVWYPFNGNANDESGNGNNGIVHFATLTTDRFGISNAAYSFNGSYNYISLPLNSGRLAGSENFSISFWVNQVDNANTQSVYNHWTSFGNPNGTPVGFIADVFNGQATAAYIADSMVGSFPLMTINNWHHVVIIYEGTQAINANREKLYVDGVAEVLDTSCFHCTPNIPPSIGTNGNFTLIGARNDNFANLQNFFHGKIDDIGIWNRSLTPCEVRQLYYSSTLSIITQPINQVAETEHQVAFYVYSSDSCLSYQWQQNCGSGFINLVNSSIISGANSDSLVIKPASPALNNCQYRCIISSCVLCSISTDTAALTITIGINDPDFSGFRFFPNPFTDEINFSIDNNSESEITIYDIITRKIISQYFVNSVSLDTQRLAKGIYILEVKNKNGISAKGKLIKD